jgi:hypothetical protein
MRADRTRSFTSTLLAVAALASVEASVRTAAAFCRTTTCQLPPSFSPEPGECAPPDYESYCASRNQKVLPLYWANACVGYDIQQNASKFVPYDTATDLFSKAFGQWTGINCGAGRVSIDTANLGPVSCDKVQYNSDQGNQHVIILYDTDWPHEDDTVNTLGLTTMTYNPDTGEIYDADMEINTSKAPLVVEGPLPAVPFYDFQSIIQHETGHFLGLAHSGDASATMYAHYTPGTTSMRVLSTDDKDGLCSAYLPDGNRAVDPSVAPSGTLKGATCDPTPRHGFQSACATSQKCSLSASPTGRGLPGTGYALGLAAALGFARRARRKRR